MHNLHASDTIYFPKNIEAWLNFLKDHNQRNLLSTSTETLVKAYQEAIKLNVLGIKVPEEFGGTNLDLKAQYYFYKNIAITSATLAFFCAQHIAGMSIIASGNNLTLKEKYLSQNHNGEYSFGISFAHLKHIKNPPVSASIKDENSYLINGTLSYVTGYKIFNTLVLGFTCGTKEIFAITPFSESHSLIVTKNLELVAATSTNTVVCKLVDHVITKNNVIVENEIGTLANNTDKNVRHLAAIGLGLASATLQLLPPSEYLEITEVREIYNELNKEFLSLENDLLHLPNNTSVTPLRVKITYFFNKLFLFSEQIIKGNGILEEHTLSTIRKESMIIAASASNTNTLIETCEILRKNITT